MTTPTDYDDASRAAKLRRLAMFQVTTSAMRQQIGLLRDAGVTLDALPAELLQVRDILRKLDADLAAQVQALQARA